MEPPTIEALVVWEVAAEIGNTKIDNELYYRYRLDKRARGAEYQLDSPSQLNVYDKGVDLGGAEGGEDCTDI